MPVKNKAPSNSLIKTSSLSLDTPPFQTPVSFEVKRQALPEFLQEVSRQSGLALQGSVDLGVSKKKLTAWGKTMPLRDLMHALEQLYAAEWVQKAPNSYELQPKKQSELVTRLDQTRRALWFRRRERTLESLRADQKEWHTVAQTVWDHADEAALRSPEGFAFTRLPVEVQQTLRTHFSRILGRKIFDNYRHNTVLLGPELKGENCWLQIYAHELTHNFNGKEKKVMRLAPPRLTNDDGTRWVEVCRAFSDLMPAEPDPVPPGMQKWLDEVKAKQKAGAAPAKNDVKAAPAR